MGHQRKSNGIWIRSNQGGSKGIWIRSNQRESKGIWIRSNQRQSKAIKGNQRQSQAITGNRVQCVQCVQAAIEAVRGVRGVRCVEVQGRMEGDLSGGDARSGEDPCGDLVVIEYSHGGVVVKTCNVRRGCEDHAMLREQGFVCVSPTSSDSSDSSDVIREYMCVSVARGAQLDDLLQTAVVEPAFCMQTDVVTLRPKVFVTDRGVFANLKAVLVRAGFKHSKFGPGGPCWSKRILDCRPFGNALQYYNSLVENYGKAKRAAEDSPQVAEARKLVMNEHQRSRDRLQLEIDRVLDRMTLRFFNLQEMCRRACSDAEYMHASRSYGQLIKEMAARGEYDYPEPPEFPAWSR